MKFVITLILLLVCIKELGTIFIYECYVKFSYHCCAHQIEKSMISYFKIIKNKFLISNIKLLKINIICYMIVDYS